MISSGFITINKEHIRDVIKPSFAENLYKFVFIQTCVSLIVSVYLGEPAQFIKIYRKAPEILPDLIQYIVCSAFGYISYCASILCIGSIYTTMTATVRKVLSILLSLYIFGHKLNFNQTIGLGLVFSSIAFELVQNMRKVWAGKENTDPNKDKVKQE